ncbi:MAG: hypothetical protein ACI4A8_06015 [Muribaculaceae bacterium]
MRKFIINVVAVISVIGCNCIMAHESNDSLAYDFRAYVAKNFSRHRTMNFYYETKASHNYTLSMNGKTLEEGRKHDIHTIRFSTMIPIVRQRKVSFYANIMYSSYCFKTSDEVPSTVFHERANAYYAGGFSGSFYTTLLSKPLVLSASITGDAGGNVWGKLYGRISVMTVLRNSVSTTFNLGLMGMTLFNSVPVIPIIAYWHRFCNPDWSIDITLPSQIYLRYQMRSHRLSAGTSMSVDGFYMKPQLKGSPQVCYYSEAVINPNICYEFIINQHFFLSVCAGVSAPMKAGLYHKNRKGIDSKGTGYGSNPIIGQDRNVQPFFNLGVSYSIFK